MQVNYNSYSHFLSGEDWLEYVAAPFATHHEEPPAFAFVVPLTQAPASEVPTFAKPQGNIGFSNNSQSGCSMSKTEIILIKKGRRKGLALDLGRRKVNAKVSLPTPDAPPKYSSIPHPLSELKGAALPLEASRVDTERAIASFSISAKSKTSVKVSTLLPKQLLISLARSL